MTKELIARTEITVRFCEVDSLRIVWHGNYFKYFEDGREAFALKYGINYLDIYEKEGLAIPLVKTICEHKLPLKYNDKAVVEARFVDSDAAKIIFQYKIFRASDNKLATTGETVQIFLNKNDELQLTVPRFFIEWKKKWGLR